MSVARERALTQDVPSLLDVPLPVEMSVARERAFPRQNSQSKLDIRDIEINTVSSKKSPFPAIFLFGAIYRAWAQRQKWRNAPSQRAGKKIRII